MRKTIQTALRCATALSALSAIVPQAAWAQGPAPAAEETVSDATITVTARKRDESIVDVPLAITVVSSDKIAKLGITSTSDLANYVPGLQFSDYTPGYARNDRGGTRPLIFRGLNVGTGGSVSSGGGMFLDGAAVVGNEVPAGMDIGAVEVLRGPQSVYFGRSTMTGAVSYRTKEIPDHWGAEMLVTLAERDRKDIEASIAGPILPGLLKARITGLWEDQGGYVTNTYDGSTLGDRSRKSISAATDFTPTETIKIKSYINYFRDEDGPSATAFVPASANNCKFPGAIRTTFCGAIPSKSASINYHNTNIPAAAARIFASPLIKGAGFKNQVGLQREVLNSHVVASWDISDYLSLESITGYHTNVTLQASDGKGRAPIASDTNQRYVYTITNKSRDFSQELRLSSDSERTFSWTLGGNYINAYDKTNALLYYLRPASATPDTFIPQTVGTQLSKTYGVFGGGYLKLFDKKLTISAEGRYQIDERGTFNVDYLTGTQVGDRLAKTFRSFNPRVAIDYDIGGGRKVYVSYASGTRPGGFNSSLLQAIARVGTVAVQEAFGVSDASFKEERLKIGELGIKGSFGGGKGYFDINTYYGKLSGQQVGASSILFCRIQPTCTIAGGGTVPFGTQDAFSTTATNNAGESEVYGVEWQGSYTFMRGLSLATTFAWNHTKRTKFDSFSSIAQFGTRTLDGVQFANTPEISGSAVLSYERPVSDEWNFFYTGSAVYRGKQYVDAYNAAYIKGRAQFDARLGFDNKTYTIEAFVTNILNNQNYTGGSVAPNFDDITYHGFFGAWAPPRTFGGRLRVKI